jgi:hypothetical protein
MEIFDFLPFEMISKIFSYLSYIDIISMPFISNRLEYYISFILYPIHSFSIPTNDLIDNNSQLVSSSKIIAIIDRCPNLVKLIIGNEGGFEPSFRLDQVISPIPNRLNYLEIRGIHFDELLLESVKGFHKLRSLIIQDFVYGYGLTETNFLRLLRSIPNLETCELSTVSLFCNFKQSDLTDIWESFIYKIKNSIIEAEALAFFLHDLQ